MSDAIYLRVTHQRNAISGEGYAVFSLVQPDGTVVAGWAPIPVRDDQTITAPPIAAGVFDPQLKVVFTRDGYEDRYILSPAYVIV